MVFVTRFPSLLIGNFSAVAFVLRPMKLLISGSRRWADRTPMESVIRRLNPHLIIHGGARGADTLAELIACELEIPTAVYPADWRMGRRAGPIRTATMIRLARPDRVAAFPLGDSPGTYDLIRQAQRAGIPVEIHTLSLR
jgi:hypothetical protein